MFLRKSPGPWAVVADHQQTEGCECRSMGQGCDKNLTARPNGHVRSMVMSHRIINFIPKVATMMLQPEQSRKFFFLQIIFKKRNGLARSIYLHLSKAACMRPWLLFCQMSQISVLEEKKNERYFQMSQTRVLELKKKNERYFQMAQL